MSLSPRVMYILSSPCTWGLTGVRMDVADEKHEFPMYVGINRPGAHSPISSGGVPHVRGD